MRMSVWSLPSGLEALALHASPPAMGKGAGRRAMCLDGCTVYMRLGIHMRECSTLNGEVPWLYKRILSYVHSDTARIYIYIEADSETPACSFYSVRVDRDSSRSLGLLHPS